MTGTLTACKLLHLKQMCCATVVQTPEWGKWKVDYVYSHSIIQPLQWAASINTKSSPICSTPSCFDYNSRTNAKWLQRVDIILRVDFSLHVALATKILYNIISVYRREKKKPATLSKASFSGGDNDVGPDELCCNWVLMKMARTGMPDVWSVSSGRASVVQAASVSMF